MRTTTRATLLCALLFAGCHSTTNNEDIVAELLKQHKASLQHHFELNAEALVRDNLNPFIAVSNGAVDTSSRKDAELMFRNYFSGATYTVYEDLQSPIVRVSDDGSMAWMITRTRVARKKTYGEKEVQEKFTYAGIMTYKNVDGKWMREANVSTFRVDDQK